MHTSLPTGTVTFLFTDIEDSTGLAQRYPAELPTLLSQHHAILHQSIETHRGKVFQIVGDAFCAAFFTATDALHAALQAQRKLQQVAWHPVALKVRMGVHTGPAQAGRIEDVTGGYTGYQTLTRAQRVMSSAHGEQILISSATAELLRGDLPEGVELRDMGEHRLKGLLNPEHLWQVTAPGLLSEFPALPSLNVIPNNLPVQLTSFIGRERELAELKHLLLSNRLLTLTGPGGTGKTRLALHLAADVLESFAQGAWLVELAPLADPTLVIQRVAATLGVREQPARTLLDALMDYMRTKTLLLILDNCEHLIETCAQLADTLLRSAPGLKIFATSRESLGIAGETAFSVPSLALPDPGQLSNLDALAQNDCVRLFIERASAMYPRFRLTAKNASAIAQICLRLDGIPLAIELAAARTKAFPPEQIAARLDDRFRLLTGGSRTALERHQTLLALIDWSHNLLSQAERLLLRRLSVFAGGWSMEAAQAVCGDGLGDEVLELLTHLVDKSLVVVEEEAEEGRYSMLETIRQYARDKLLASGEAESVRDHHLDFFLSFAEEAEPKLRSPEQLEWLDRVETEHDNLRVALAWSSESGDATAGLRLAGSLWFFWDMHSHQSEGLARLEGLLARASKRTQARARALFGAGLFKYRRGDYESARTLLQESLSICRELGDKYGSALSLGRLCSVAYTQGDHAEALLFADESLALYQELDDQWGIAHILNGKGELARLQGDYEAAGGFYEEGLALSRELGDQFEICILLHNLAYVVQHQGDYQRAALLFKESLIASQELGEKVNAALDVAGLAGIAGLTMQPERAARLFGAAQAALTTLGIVLDAIDRSDLERDVQMVKTQLDAASFATLWEEGSGMSLEQAAEYALTV